MKRYNFILILLAILTQVGCNKEVNQSGTEWGDVNVPLDPSKHYIHFDADIKTRGALIEGSLLNNKFAVVGYQHRGNWEAEEVLAAPNVFETTPQIITYADGIFSYSPMRVWSGNKYSFFGYYPADNNNVTLTATQGTPYITYTLPEDNDPTKLIDVMTADYIDTGVAASASVAMPFRHRLCAIDVGARNYYEYNHDGDATTPNKDVTIEITRLVVNLSNIVNTSAKIYLDHNHTPPMEFPAQQSKATRVYAMVDINTPWAVKTFDVIPNTASDRAIRLITNQSGQNASSMLFIPQTELVTGKLDITYKKKYKKDDLLDDEVAENWVYLHEGNNENDFDFTPTDLDINFTKQLIEGRRYYIELTFTSDAVSVNIIAADEWNTIPDVKHEFE